MTISPINISRVSHNLQTEFMLQSMRRTQRELFVAQTRIASGRSFTTASEDPVAAARALNLSEALAQQERFMANLQYGDNFLAAADSAINEIADLISQASVIASQTVGSMTTAAERESEAEVVAAIREQLQAVGNRQFMGRYIFGGSVDRVIRPNQVWALWQHWERPRIAWYAGSHVSYHWQPEVKALIDEALVVSGLVKL